MGGKSSSTIKRTAAFAGAIALVCALVAAVNLFAPTAVPSTSRDANWSLDTPLVATSDQGDGSSEADLWRHDAYVAPDGGGQIVSGGGVRL